MQKLIEFIKEYGLEALSTKYSIKIKQHLEYSELVSLCYHHTKTPKNEITNECRGLIINKNTLEIVARSFTRFEDLHYKKYLNNGVEDYKILDNPKFNFNNFNVYEKIDGSLINMYYYDGKWHIGTKGTPDGNGIIRGYDKSYKDLFWEVWNDLNYTPPPNKKFTYIFEFKFPSKFSFITKTDISTINLIGIRSKETGVEVKLHWFSYIETDCNWEIKESYSFNNTTNNIKEVIKYVEKINPLEEEGFVIVDNNFNRLKVKNYLYEKLALLSSFSKEGILTEEQKQNNFRVLLKIAAYTDSINFLEYYPNCKNDFLLILKAKKKVINKIDELKIRIEGLNPQAIGKIQTDNVYKKCLYNLNNSKSVEEYLEFLSEDYYIALIKHELNK